MAAALGRLLVPKLAEAAPPLRLRRDAEGALVLGSLEHPFPAAGTVDHAAAVEQLEGLRQREGERLRLIARPGDLLPCGRLLADLDRGHAVTVEAVLEVFDPRLPEAVEALDAVARLAALGLAVRVCPVASDAVPSSDALRLFYGAVALSGGFEVRWRAAGSLPDTFVERCRYLSLLHEFPRPVIGRG